jgi:hypothetical protein
MDSESREDPPVIARIRAAIAAVEQGGATASRLLLGKGALAVLTGADRYDRIRYGVDLERHTFRGIPYEPSDDQGEDVVALP